VLGQALGLKTEEFDALQADDYRDSALFSDKEKAVIAWAEAMTLNTAKRDNKVWDDLKKHFNDAEIVEISLITGMFNMTGSMIPSAPNWRAKNTTAASTVQSASPVRHWKTTPAASARRNPHDQSITYHW
jgi:hypothetical protein